MKRPSQPVQGEPQDRNIRIDPDSLLVRRAPMLYAMMTDDKWDDGDARETSTLTLFVDAGMLKAVLNDRALSRTAFASSATLEGLLDALEEGLEADSLDWRVKPETKRRK